MAFATRKPARDQIVTFRVRPATGRLIRICARADGRSISRFLENLVEQTLVGNDTREQ